MPWFDSLAHFLTPAIDMIMGPGLPTVMYTSSLLYSQEPSGALSTGSSSSSGSSGMVMLSKPTSTASNSGVLPTSQSSKSSVAMHGVSVPNGGLWAAGSGIFIVMGMMLIHWPHSVLNGHSGFQCQQWYATKSFISSKNSMQLLSHTWLCVTTSSPR